MTTKDKKNTEEEIFINRDDLRDYIHQIHDDLRNAGAGYGQTGLKIFSVFYGLKLIKPNLHKLKIKEEYKKILDWDELVKRVNSGKGEIIAYIDKEVLQALFELKEDCKKTGNRDSEVGHFIFHQIPTDLSDEIWKSLILKIDKIPVGFKGNDKVNLSGKLWEYFVGRDKTAISELGAYFTDRPVTNYIFDRLKPTLDDEKNVHTMIDPYGGSGGFTLGYANYIRSNYDNINWRKNVDNIYHFDMEETVVKMTGLEMFAITGYFPKRDDKCNFTRGNTFQTEFGDKDNKPKKYHYVISNPPYGGDKKKKNAQDIKRDKIIEYLKSMKGLNEVKKKQLSNLITEKNMLDKKKKAEQTVNKSTCSKRINAFCKTHKIDVANDKEACSLILLMDLLEKDGTCIGVLKEGVFFDGKYSKVREVLLNNYNVTDIISIPSNAFENTTTKTSIIIFHNNGPTKKIKFSELIIHKVKEDKFEEGENGEIILTKIKEDFDIIEEKSFSETTIKIIKELKTKNRCIYSLNAKDYKDYKVNCPDGFEMKKLSDLCEINYGTRIVKENSIRGDIPVYGSGFKSSNTTEFNRDGMTCKIGRFAVSKDNCVMMLNKKYYLNDSGLTIENKDKLKFTYVSNYLLNNKDIVFECVKGSVQKALDIELFKKLQIPFPKDITKLKPQLDKLYKLHQQIAMNTEDIPEKEKAICDIIKSATDSGKKGVDYEEYKLGDKSFNIIYGTRITKNNNILGDIPVYGGGDITFYTNKSNLSGKNILISRFGNCVKDKCTKIINGNIFLNDSGFTIKSNTKNISNDLLLYTLRNYNDVIYECKRGSAQLNMNMDDIKNTMIKVLTEKQMKKLKLQELFDEVGELKETLEKNKEQYQNMMKEMFKDFEEDEESDNEESSDSESESESDNSSSSDSEESEDEKPVKKSNKKKVETTSESESEEEQPVKKVTKSPTKKVVKK